MSAQRTVLSVGPSEWGNALSQVLPEGQFRFYPSDHLADISAELPNEEYCVTVLALPLKNEPAGFREWLFDRTLHSGTKMAVTFADESKIDRHWLDLFARLERRHKNLVPSDQSSLREWWDRMIKWGRGPADVPEKERALARKAIDLRWNPHANPVTRRELLVAKCAQLLDSWISSEIQRAGANSLMINHFQFLKSRIENAVFSNRMERADPTRWCKAAFIANCLRLGRLGLVNLAPDGVETNYVSSASGEPIPTFVEVRLGILLAILLFVASSYLTLHEEPNPPSPWCKIDMMERVVAIDFPHVKPDSLAQIPLLDDQFTLRDFLQTEAQQPGAWIEFPDVATLTPFTMFLKRAR
jgi:hypothetical protein